MEIPAGSVVITPTELYKEMQTTHQILSEIRLDLKSLTAIVPDHETRLRALERKLWIATGATATITASLTQILNTLLAH